MTIEVSSAFYWKNNNRPSYLMTGLRRQREAVIVASFPGPWLNTDVDLLIETVGRSRAASDLGDPLESMNPHMSCHQENQPHRVSHSVTSTCQVVTAQTTLGLALALFIPLVSESVQLFPLFLILHSCLLARFAFTPLFPTVPDIQCRWMWCSLGRFAIIQHEIPCWIEFSGAAALRVVRCFLFKWLHWVTRQFQSVNL